jgi:hypothetical protein
VFWEWIEDKSTRMFHVNPPKSGCMDEKPAQARQVAWVGSRQLLSGPRIASPMASCLSRVLNMSPGRLGWEDGALEHTAPRQEFPVWMEQHTNSTGYTRRCHTSPSTFSKFQGGDQSM